MTDNNKYTISGPSTFIRPSHVLIREVGDEILLLNSETQIYFSLDDVGALLFKLLEEGSSFHDCLGTMVNTYDVDPEQLRTDCEQLLQQLLAESLIATKAA